MIKSAWLSYGLLQCSFGAASGVQSKHDALLAMTMLHLFRNTFREVIEAALLINVSTKLVYHMVYPHQLKHKTMLQLQCVST
jgi:hypothetical protein